MTQSRDVDRVVERWLGSGPTVAHDRVLEGALAQIEHTPQRGAGFAPWRYRDMPTPLRLLLIAALMAASAGAALFAAGQLPQQDDRQTPLPTETRTGPGIMIGSDPQGGWTAERPATFGSTAGSYRLIIQAPVRSLLAESPEGRQILLGPVALHVEQPPGTLSPQQIVELGPTDRCGGTGSYMFEVAADGNTMTVTMRSDACAERSTLFAGSWDREYVAWNLRPETRYRAELPGLSVDVTVPRTFVSSGGGAPYIASWPNPTSTAKFQTDDVTFLVAAGGSVIADRCHESRGSRPIPGTIDEYLTWTRSSEGTQMSDPVRLTVAGHPAARVDVNGTDACEPARDGLPFWSTPRSGPMGTAVHSREWAVDVDGRLLLVALFDDNVPFAPLTPEMQAIGEAFLISLEVKRSG